MSRLGPVIAAGGNRYVRWTRVGAIVTLDVRIAKATPLKLTLPATIKKLQPKEKK